MTESGSQQHRREFALICLLVLAFGPALSGILRRTIELNGYYDHLALAAAVSAWFLVRGWHGPGKSSRWGWPPLFVGLWINVVGRTEEVLLLQVLGLALTLWGLVLLRGGFHLLWRLRFPLTFLLLAIPLPRFLLDATTGSLRRLVTRGAVVCLELLNVPAVPQGTSILMNDLRVEVDPSCSGLQGLLAFVAMGALLARSIGGWWRPAALCLCSLLVALLGNLFRVLVLTGIAAIAPLWVNDSTIHVGVGLGVYGFGFLALHAVKAPLSNSATVAESSPQPNCPARKCSRFALVVVAVGAGVAWALPVELSRRPELQLPVPVQVGPWLGERLLAPKSGLGVLYVRYRQQGQAGFVDLYAIVGTGSRFDMHLPSGCFKGEGFARAQAQPIVDLPEVATIEVYSRGTEKYLVAVWRRRGESDLPVPGPFDLRLEACLKRLVFKRDQREVLVRLVTPMDKGSATRLSELAKGIQPWIAATGPP